MKVHSYAKTHVRSSSYRNSQGGILLALVFVLCIFLFFLGFGFIQFSSQQNALAHIQRYGEMARFLAESGIEIARESLQRQCGEENSKLRQQILTLSPTPGPVPLDLGQTFQADLSECAMNLDSSARLQVTISLSSVIQTETDPTRWNDPVAKTAWLSVEARGEYRGVQSTLITRSRLSVANCLPPVFSKFTLHISSAKTQDYFNVVRNDDCGTILPGPQPLYCFNHTISGNPLQESVSLDDITNPTIFQKRGWIFIGRGPTRLNLTAGNEKAGEHFFFKNIDFPRNRLAEIYSQPSKQLSQSELPPSFPRTIRANKDVLWDTSSKADYQLGFHFVFEGFYEKSEKKPTEAMYSTGILSETERNTFGSHSSLLHLFGDARRGFRSRTRVLGKVFAAVSRLSNLEILPIGDKELEDSFRAQEPPPQYLIPSMSEDEFDPLTKIFDILNRHFGGPLLTVGDLAPNYSDYDLLRSKVLEVSYARLYNCFQDVLDGKEPLQNRLPTSQDHLSECDGTSIILQNEDQVIFNGNGASPTAYLEIVEGRIQNDVSSISDFWDKYYDQDTNSLRIESIVRIRNYDNANLILPRPGTVGPLHVSGRGMIVLERGNLILRGVSLSNTTETLTVILAKGEDVFIGSQYPNYINVVAPNAKLHATDPFMLYGTLAVLDIPPVAGFLGGAIHYRESQDPTGSDYSRYYIIGISEGEYSWHG